MNRFFPPIAALILAGCQPAATDGPLMLSGNLELVDAQLSFKYPGRVAERLVDEGQRVKAGQLVARLDDSEQVQEVALRRAELAAARALLAELEAGSRPQEIAAAEAVLRSAQAERERAELDFNRQQELLQRNAIPTRDFDSARAQLRVAEARVAETRERARLIQAGPRPETILQARARTEQASAALALAQTRLDQTRLVSTLDGVVLSHHVEAGEFVAAGTPVVTVTDTVHMWVRAYLNETDLGRLRLGQKVTVRTDAAANRTHEGTVAFISSEAEFTPKTVQTPKERVRLVYRVKVDVLNPRDELKTGMPADVIVPVATESAASTKGR
ncbi:MAG: HlyD family efflux transporter periplasmic adaptor subunit [Opitutaceae bacterium]